MEKYEDGKVFAMFLTERGAGVTDKVLTMEEFWQGKWLVFVGTNYTGTQSEKLGNLTTITLWHSQDSNPDQDDSESNTLPPTT